MRFPLLLLLLVVACLLALGFVTVPDCIGHHLKHTLVVLLIGAIGWLCCRIVKKIYCRFLSRIGDREKADPASRSLLTQVIFLYRLAIFAIIVVTAATILMTFPYIKSVGVGILGSAGIAGIALGIAARPILLNLMAGFQIAMTKTVKIGDVLVVDGETARVESIHLTHIIFLTWDLRRLIVPISRFIDQSYQNWEVSDPEIIASLELYCDYRVPVDAFREHVGKLVAQSPYWNKRVWKVQVTGCSPEAVEIRISASANHPADANELRSFLREELIGFLQKEHPESLPCVRQLRVET